MDANFFTSNNTISPLGRHQAPALDGLAHGLQGLSLGGSSPAAYHPPHDGILGFLETPPPSLPMSYGSDVNLFVPRNPLLDPKPDFSRQRTSVADHNKSYRFQEYLERCCYKEIATIVLALTRNRYTLVHMAKSEDSVNFVKKLIEVAKKSPVLLNCITSALGISGAYQLMVDLNGFKLILHCLNDLRAEDNLFIYASAVRFCSQIAKTVKGIVCLKECITKSSTQYRTLLLIEVVKHSVSLATDPHGNFLVQFVIDLRHAIVNKCICAFVADHLEHISTNKNGSYVVEKCLKSEGGEFLLEGFVRLGIDKLEGLAMHPQGNYVLQCAIRLDKESRFRAELVQAIRQLPDYLSCDKYAKNVLILVRESRRGNAQA